jgi:DNA replication protein DnaC
MDPIQTLIPGLAGRVQMLAGTCEQHGAAEVLVRTGAAWHCPRCLDAVLAAEARDSWMTERAAALMTAATIPKKYVGQKFVASTPEQKGVKHTTRLFRDFILGEPAWGALILSGTTGTGKTLLACDLAQSLIQNAVRSIRYITANGMISEIQASYSDDKKTKEGEILRFLQYDVLILDEIDAKPDREDSNLLLTEVINRRYNDNKPVIAISNQPLADMAKFVGDRVHSRLHENAFICAFTWADARKGSGQPGAQVHHIAGGRRA